MAMKARECLMRTPCISASRNARAARPRGVGVRVACTDEAVPNPLSVTYDGTLAVDIRGSAHVTIAQRTPLSPPQVGEPDLLR